MAPRFLDSHCHLDKLKLEPDSGGLAGAISAASAAGVGQVLCIGIGLDNLDTVVAIAEEFPAVHAAVGIHPSEYMRHEGHAAHPPALPVALAKLESLLAHPRVVAVGETGLDFYHDGGAVDHAGRQAQQDSFRAHLQLARQHAFPVVVHSRMAREETLAAIREAGSPAAGVLHCFTEDWDMATRAMDMGYYVSISGIVTFRNADNVRDVARRLPLDRLLVETDAPWLTPAPHRGRPNEPRHVVEVYRFLASLRDEPIERLADAVWQNFHTLFPRTGAPKPV